MEFAEVVKNRYSCKKYDGKQISAEQLDAVLQAGRLAPTAKNLQGQRIYVVQSAEGLAKIDELTPCRYGAPTVLVVAFDKNSVFVYPGEEANSGGGCVHRRHPHDAGRDEHGRGQLLAELF